MTNGVALAKVLVVEDSSVQAHLEKRILEKGGYEVELADSGKAALECLKNSSFDLVISDVMMPGMSGYELCQKIKSQEDMKAIPVVLITALNELKDLVEGLKVGADNFITKPFEPIDMLQRIAMVLNSSQNEPLQQCDAATGTCFISQKFVMNLDRKKILDYLVSTFDDYFRARHRESEIKARESRRRLLEVEQKEQFLTNLAHDLSAPVTSMQSQLDSLMGGQCGELTVEQHVALSQLKQDSHRPTDRIENLILAYKTLDNYNRSVA